MKRFISIMLLFPLLLSGCVYQADLRPEYSDIYVWICEEPYIELCWSKTNDETGLIVLNDSQYDITHSETSGSTIWIYSSEAKNMLSLDEQEKFKLFRGDVKYGKEKLSIEVKEDFKNIFNGELPILEFKRYNKKEYLENTKK